MKKLTQVIVVAAVTAAITIMNAGNNEAAVIGGPPTHHAFHKKSCRSLDYGHGKHRIRCFGLVTTGGQVNDTWYYPTVPFSIFRNLYIKFETNQCTYPNSKSGNVVCRKWIRSPLFVRP